MQFYYRDQTPLGILDKTAYWKIQEKEHASFIRGIMTDLDPEQVKSLKQWEDTLDTTHLHVRRFIGSATRSDGQIAPQLYDQVLELISFCLQESVGFIQFFRKIKMTDKIVQNNPIARRSIDHVINQSDYFVGFAHAVLHHKN